MILRILFLILKRADVWFTEREFVWRVYKTSRVEIINNKEFAVVVQNADNKTFVIYIVALAEQTTMLIYPSHQVQIDLQISEEIGISVEYSDFSNMFSSNSMADLPEHNGINDHPIKLLDNI